LKTENEKLKEEIEFLKNKVSSYETVIESQKVEIEMLQSFTDFNKESRRQDSVYFDKEQYLDINISDKEKG
jgi:hypothetical protein